ncbi:MULTISPECIES: TrkA family potassium uptake protein [unclassified Mycoplasma]|uniref:potassium channel family protein n=1 Tax=unclassified Mycoplasma TaxID=2683645 RepID=UPI00211BDA3E|nr:MULTISPECIES: TrkA family potassium uptake protein [unclassified Mycoplasma]UUM20097.1 TrkA family potassium uptake protein [Mycoplasma sp. 1578d]UUM25077.1 TrkA family potassium uptake protein [Mycoplasma sp. 3686d]
MGIKYKNDIAVIGTGRFGRAVIDQLITMNKSVLVIDKDEESARNFVDDVQRVVIADAAEIKALKGIGIENIETVVVAVSDNIEIVAALQEQGVKNLIVRAINERHARVLNQIGVNIIIRPEHEAGIRTALIAGNRHFIDYSANLKELGDNFVLGTTKVISENFSDKKIRDLNFNNFGVTIVLIKRGAVTIRPQGDTELKREDLVTIIGEIADVTHIFKLLNTSEII